jgi:hypothetical protein
MGDKRVTSHRNPDTGKYDVLIVKDGPDGIPEETEVDSSWDTSPQANERVRQIKDDVEKAARTAASPKKSEAPKRR